MADCAKPSIVRREEGPTIDCDSARVVRKKGSCAVATRGGQSRRAPSGTSTFYYCGRHPPSFYHPSKLMVHAASDQNQHTHTPISNIFVLYCSNCLIAVQSRNDLVSQLGTTFVSSLIFFQKIYMFYLTMWLGIQEIRFHRYSIPFPNPTSS